MNIQKRQDVTDVMLPKMPTVGSQRVLAFHGAKVWNTLEMDAKDAPSLSIFKNRLTN